MTYRRVFRGAKHKQATMEREPSFLGEYPRNGPGVNLSGKTCCSTRRGLFLLADARFANSEAQRDQGHGGSGETEGEGHP